MHRFYDRLSPFYHLIYEDWEASIARQARQLDEVIRSQWGESARSVLDVTCGIGTQSLGLAALGYQVNASDLSPDAIARAREEARSRGLHIPFSVCDVRQAHTRHGSGFDVVLSADNSITHLLDDASIVEALESMLACLRPGGGCLLSVRAYDREQPGTGLVKPYVLREEDGKRYLIWQIWDYEGERYELSMYVVEDEGGSKKPEVHVMRSTYYAIHPGDLLALMERAGFKHVARLDDAFFQPVLVGTRPA